MPRTVLSAQNISVGIPVIETGEVKRRSSANEASAPVLVVLVLLISSTSATPEVLPNFQSNLDLLEIYLASVLGTTSERFAY